ncbi:hypothetical protein RIF25_02820 [Thermosynechococcaceae cyanobacterium BACA0444]|uniref:Uncharacterized protein n=1 Tax=Pseudocalidococcus azoricus BACA0444 TaxID=2918990 RepID=A0AAE4FQC9_9CYAN|nr:hypothetical protein [Pseudocalidococcus azoricus]MDS3859734.1 hypothetical protein [Pseudocalidococcus azoricus BACA0444]
MADYTPQFEPSRILNLLLINNLGVYLVGSPIVRMSGDGISKKLPIAIDHRIGQDQSTALAWVKHFPILCP